MQMVLAGSAILEESEVDRFSPAGRREPLFSSLATSREKTASATTGLAPRALLSVNP